MCGNVEVVYISGIELLNTCIKKLYSNCLHSLIRVSKREVNT